MQNTQTKSAQTLLSNLIYKTKTIRIETSKIINITGVLVFVHHITCFTVEMLLYRIPFFVFPVLDVWLGDCGIPISV